MTIDANLLTGFEYGICCGTILGTFITLLATITLFGRKK